MTTSPPIEPNGRANRRDIVKGLGGVFAASAIVAAPRASAQAAPGPGNGASTQPVITRRLPQSDQVVPVIGLGTFLTFDLFPGQPRDHLKTVLGTYWDAGSRVIDTSPLYGTAEYSVGDFVSERGVNEDMFISNKIWSTGEFTNDDSHAWRSLQQSKGRLWRDRIDVLHCHSITNADAIIPILQAWKAEGHLRFIGMTHHENLYHAALASWMERGMIDMIQVNYSIFDRGAEDRVLRVAADRGIGVLVNMPLEKARLHKVVEGQAVPAFARAFGAETWAQFFLKWVISNPVITCALPSTSNPAHALENVGALRGPLPDPDMRQRMVRHMETIPGFATLGDMPWYPDKQYPGPIRGAQAAIRARQS